jgi:hypothetical protein
MNNAAVKEYALECSKVCKGGRFTRMGEDFMAELAGDFEYIIRSIGSKTPVAWPSEVPLDGRHLLDLTDREKLYDVFTRLLARMIQRTVERQPSCGQTLGRTK